MSNLKDGDLVDDEVLYGIVPLTLRVDGVDYIDDGTQDMAKVMPLIEESKKDTPISTSCPSPQAFLDKMTGADKYIIITISNKLSGSYNAANLAKSLFERPDDVFVLDSLSNCGPEELLARRATELIHSGLSFEEIQSKLKEAVDEFHILFIINRYDSLIRTGRVSKIIASIANILKIKPLGIGKDGVLCLQEKVRTLEATIKRMVSYIGKYCKDTANRICIISHTENPEKAKQLKEMIEALYSFKEIIIRNHGVVNAEYTRTGALTVAF